MAVIENPNTATASVSNLVPGVYLFQFTTTDDMDASKSDTVQVTVLAKANRPPLANAGADVTIQLPQNGVILNGKGSDEDGSIDSYQWKQLSGPILPNFPEVASTQ